MSGLSDEAPRVPRAESYPDRVQSAEERKRWDLALAIAEQIFPEPELAADAREAAVAIYRSSIPT